MVEFALLLPFLMVMILGLVEFGRGIDEKHSLATLTRESALLAVRGTSLDSVALLVVQNGSDIMLVNNGGAIASRIDITSNRAIVRAQVKSAGFTANSRMGPVGDTTAAGLATQALIGLGLLPGSTVYVVEAFYRHTPLVPLRQLFNIAVPDTLYERAVF